MMKYDGISINGVKIVADGEVYIVTTDRDRVKMYERHVIKMLTLLDAGATVNDVISDIQEEQAKLGMFDY